MSMSVPDMIGFTGVAMLLLAFGLNLSGLLRQDGWVYALLNTVGAGVAAYASWLINYMPFVILEGVWCVVSLVALVRWMVRRPVGAH